ncbi:MAG: hypothetical protein KDI82_13715 [Gammaproteobacteria bacterium]|nr:hypothetical protein [Gammaproteobacteria bacterium]
MSRATARFPGDLQFSRRSVQFGRQLAALFGFLALAQVEVQAAPPPAYFASPGSGQRVTEYNVELPLARDRRQQFHIPADCGAVLDLTNNERAYKGTIIDRRLWRKVDNDCRYHGFLHRHPLQDIEDHISRYDFMNARLDELHIGQHCADGITGNRECDWLHQEPSSFPPLSTAQAEPTSLAYCRLRNGVLYGRLVVSGDEIRCICEPQHPTLRLVTVDFADINGDHVMDAVLRFVPIGPGALRAPIIVLLTRDAADAELQRLDDSRSSLPWQTNLAPDSQADRAGIRGPD